MTQVYFFRYKGCKHHTHFFRFSAVDHPPPRASGYHLHIVYVMIVDIYTESGLLSHRGKVSLKTFSISIRFNYEIRLFLPKFAVLCYNIKKINSTPATGTLGEQILKGILGYIKNLKLTKFIGELTLQLSKVFGPLFTECIITYTAFLSVLILNIVKSYNLYITKSRKENPQKLTQLSSRSHPRHLVGKRTAQKDIQLYHHRHHKRQPGEQQFPKQVVTG